MKSNNSPKILILDIETAPILTRVWNIWEQNIGLNQIVSDWHILSFAAKWLDDPANKVIYRDQRDAKNIENDKSLLECIWNLLNECDILITQNGVSFDVKKLNARFILNGMQPPSSYKNIDTCLIARKKFSFTSNKLEYLTNKLCTKYKKLKHRKYPGFDLWTQVLRGNKSAWNEMAKYNKYDVLSLEELYKKLIPWDNSINFSLYSDTDEHVCSCGSKKFIKRGFHYTSTSKFQRYKCAKCGAWSRGKKNLFPKDKRESLKVGIK